MYRVEGRTQQQQYQCIHDEETAEMSMNSARAPLHVHSLRPFTRHLLPSNKVTELIKVLLLSLSLSLPPLHNLQVNCDWSRESESIVREIAFTKVSVLLIAWPASLFISCLYLSPRVTSDRASDLLIGLTVTSLSLSLYYAQHTRQVILFVVQRHAKRPSIDLLHWSLALAQWMFNSVSHSVLQLCKKKETERENASETSATL